MILLDQVKYWIWLSAAKGIGPHKAGRLLEYFGDARNIYFAREGELRCVDGLTDREIDALMDKGMKKAAMAEEICRRRGFGIVCLCDDEYPARLKEIPGPPPVLFYSGDISCLERSVTVGMVGSRKASADGQISARRLAFEIAGCGGTVVTGMAEGIDTMSAMGAIEAGGKVVGVLGCGIDVVYPRKNGKLYTQVAENGVLISEFLPGTAPLSHNFPIRNRIISGLSLAVVVVEAGERSGALITADHAAEQGKDVFAVPGSINSPTCVGSNALLQEGAQMARTGWDVMSVYKIYYPDIIRAPERDAAPAEFRAVKTARPAEKPAAPAPGLTIGMLEERLKENSAAEKAVAKCLLDGEKSRDEIIARTGLSPAEVLAALTMLEIEATAVQLPGGRFRLSDEL